MPWFSPNSPQLNPIPQPREALLHHDLGRDFQPSPLTWKRNRAPLPGDCQQWGKQKETHRGMGKAGEIPHGSTALAHPQVTPGMKKRENLGLSAPRPTALNTLEEGKAKAQRCQLRSSPPQHVPAPSERNKPPALRLYVVEKELSSPKRTLPWGCHGLQGQVTLLQPMSHHPSSPEPGSPRCPERCLLRIRPCSRSLNIYTHTHTGILWERLKTAEQTSQESWNLLFHLLLVPSPIRCGFCS